MLYQYVKRYLKNTFHRPSINVEWSSIDNIKFFSHIEKRYTIEDFSKDISEAKEAFRDFFEPIGKIVFRYKEESGIKFKVFPYRVKPKDSKHLKNIIKIILHNRKHIVYPYQDQNDQIAIMGKIRREVNKEVADSDESVNTKELIKYAIRIALELSDRDIITQLKRKYIVKIFEKNRVVKAEVEAPKKREGAANRFNGYTEEEIQSTYKEIFKRGNVTVTYFINSVMKNIFKKELNFRVISNKYYEEHALKIIHAAIANELTDYISLEKDYLLGVTGYLMRKHFQEIHEIMAKELIECVYEKDGNANQFLLYYNGKTIIENNKKYKRPSLSTGDGLQWNSASLIGICNLWMNTKRKKEHFERKIVETDKKLNDLEEKLIFIRPEIEEEEKIIAQAKEKLEKIEKKHQEIEAKYKYLENTNRNSSEYNKILGEYQISKQTVEEQQKIMKDATKNLTAIKDANIATYTELEFYTDRKRALLNDVKVQSVNVNSKNIQMDPILSSIAKVLMQRTEVIAG